MTRVVPRLAVLVLVGGTVAVGCGTAEESPTAVDGGQRSSPALPEAHPEERRLDATPLTTAQAAEKAQRIALVAASGSRVVEGAPGTPFTRTRFAVQQILKGSLPRDFVVQVIGGRMGDVVVPSPVQTFVKRRRYILFLGPDGSDGPTIFPQAVLEVKRAGATDVVEPAPRGVRLLAAGSSMPARALDQGPRLDDVVFSLKQYLRGRRGTP